MHVPHFTASQIDSICREGKVRLHRTAHGSWFYRPTLSMELFRVSNEDSKLTCLTYHTIPLIELQLSQTILTLALRFAGQTRALNSAQTLQRLSRVPGARSRPHVEWWRRCVATLALWAFEAIVSL
jgi:hypothetical protein